MARFKLRKPNNLKALGRFVLEAAQANSQARGRLDEKAKAIFETRIQRLVAGASSKKIKLIYDSPGAIHIVVPWVPGKPYGGNDLAEESMGLIVFCGCAS